MGPVPNYTESFSISDGGPFQQAMVKAKLHQKQRTLAIAAFCITWLPLFIITAIEGTLYSGAELSFLKDAAMQARLLVALQMLILLKDNIDRRVTSVLKYFTETLVSEEQKTKVRSVLTSTRKLTQSTATEIILLLLVILATTTFVRAGVYSSLESGATSWMTSVTEGNQVLSKAGYWAVFISIPVFQFLFIRWIWRYFVWMLLLFRLSRIKLNLLATHADKACGTGIIMMAQRTFNTLFVIGSVVLSGQFIVQLSYHPDYFNMIRNEVIGYVVISILFTLLPLVFFSKQIIRAKNMALQQLSSLAVTLSQKFEREWANDLPIEKRIEDNRVDPSMLFDYAGMYEQVQKIRAIPVTLNDIVGFGIMLLLPFVPLLFIHFSVGELLQKIGRMLA